jgi:ribosome recycling factor
MTKLLEEFKTESEKIIQSLKKELSGVRAGRPTAALVEDLKVNYYNQPTPLKQLAAIHIIPPRTIQIQAWDKEAVGAIAKAIETSSLNLAASVDGNIIRVNLPELSEERRRELIKHVKKVTENFRIQLRHLRDKINKKIQQTFDGREINEDQKFKLKEEVQKIVDEINEQINIISNNKIKEIQE